MTQQTFRARVVLASLEGVQLCEVECLLETEAAPFTLTQWCGRLSASGPAGALPAGRYLMRFPNRRVREVELASAAPRQRRFTGIGSLPMP